MTNTPNPDCIYLQPICCADTTAYGEGRMWCEHDVWTEDCDDHQPAVKYIRADLASTTEREAKLEAMIHQLGKNAAQAAKEYAEEEAKLVEALAEQLTDLIEKRNTGNRARYNKLIAAWTSKNAKAILAALSRPTLDPHALEEAGWMRIEDGGYPKGPGKRAVLLYGEIGGIYIGSYVSDRHSEEPHPWFTNGRHTQDHQTIYPPSHWRPLPGPPAIRNMGESHD